MPRRGTQTVALAVLLVTLAVCTPPSMALYSKGLSAGCSWRYLGANCITANSEFGGLFANTCTGQVLCLAFASSGFESTASLGPGGHVQISGHAVCTEGAVADLRVTITQRGVGAVAEGTTRIRCTRDAVPWALQAQTVGRGALDPGLPATACGLLQVDGEGVVPDTVQWCRDVIELTEP